MLVHKTLYHRNLNCNTQIVPNFYGINSLTHFKDKKEGENFHQIPSNIARQKI